MTDDGLLIEVRDFHPCPPPQPPPVNLSSRRGRGLHVVAAVSSPLGGDPVPDGKSVWADLRL